MATFTECETEWLEPPENNLYDLWVDHVQDELNLLLPVVENPSNATLNVLYNRQIEVNDFDSWWAAQQIHMEEYPELYKETETRSAI